jgi:hypothetical protein
MKKEFATYEQALELKELGFDEPCFAFYDESLYFPNNKNQYGTFCNQPLDAASCSAPLKQQVFRWFRDKHNLFGCIDLQCCEPAHWFFRIDDIIKNDYLYHSEDENLRIESFEEAEDACIDKLIEIVKQINYDTK